jgi:hypothetical protein
MASKKSSLSGADLGELATIANKFHAEVENTGLSMLIAAWNAGQALLTAKTLCAHGDWLPWLESCFDGSQQTASCYMRIAANYQRASDLEPEMSIRAALEAIRDQEQAALEKSSSATTRRGTKPDTDAKLRYTKVFNAVSEDVSRMIDRIGKDTEIACVAAEELNHLVTLRDELTKLIGKLRKVKA